MATIRARLGHITLKVANTRPILYVNQTREAEKTRARLRAYDIDFQERPPTEPFVSLRWSGIVYTDVFRIADFLMFAGRLPIEGVRTGTKRSDGKLPGSPISLR
jgi:hypothetical protein